MIRLILLLPFSTELPYDRYNLPKKEVSWQLRVMVMTLCVAFVYSWRHPNPALPTWDFVLTSWLWLAKYYAQSLAPYCLFDIALAVWLHGWRKWYYLGKVKAWDRFLSRFNPWFLLVMRVVAFVGLLWVGA